jgi:parvulin-like peptidyl-prolyl isomerase
MKKLFFFLIILFWVTQIYARIIERIVAIVNEDIIVLSELEEAKRKYAKLTGIPAGEISREEVEKILQGLIQKLLVFQEAKKQGIEIEDEEIDKALKPIMGQFEDEKSFKEALASQGYTLQDLIEEYRRELMCSKLIEEKIAKKVTLTEEELSLVKEEVSTQLHIRHILLNTKEEAEDVLRLLREGEDFGELARKMSLCPTREAGGDLGFITKGEMQKEFEEVAFALKEKEIGIAKTPFGYHVIQILARRPTPKEDLPRLEMKARERLWKRKFDKMLNEWVKTLKDKAYIEIRLWGEGIDQ